VHVRIIAVGKAKDRDLRSLLGDYYARIGRYAKLEEIELKDGKAEDVAERLGRSIPDRSRVVALEVKGRAFGSRDFAKWLGRAENESVQTVVFLIGGAYGLPQEPRPRVSLSVRARVRATRRGSDRYCGMRDLLGGFLGLVAPRWCPGCDERSECGAVFCPCCTALIEPAPESGAVFEYGGPVADAIQRFKYDARSELGALLGSAMAEEASCWAGRVDAVVPVPLHWRRRRARGYDQAALLAKPIARSLDRRGVCRFEAACAGAGPARG